jgi:hypothetical protein
MVRDESEVDRCRGAITEVSAEQADGGRCDTHVTTQVRTKLI